MLKNKRSKPDFYISSRVYYNECAITFLSLNDYIREKEMRKSGEIKFIGKNNCRISAKNIFYAEYFLNAYSTRNKVCRLDFSVWKGKLPNQLLW